MLYLCSASESRAKLLNEAGIDFIQKPVDFDESTIATTNGYDFVYAASKGKWQRAVELYGKSVPLLCADSVVVSETGEILRKAKDIDEARASLLKQSGRTIRIVSCVHLQLPHALFVDMSATHYRFAPFDTQALEAYLQSGEWQGKAGACMVEGFCKPYIVEVKGLESTARGLQTEIIRSWLE